MLTTEEGEALAVTLSGLGDEGSIGRLDSGTADCGNSGTSMRLLAGALASGSGTATLVGDASLSSRPMERVAEPLRLMGAAVDLDGGHAPVIVSGRRPLRPINYDVPTASAQVLGAICFAALAAEGTTIVTLPAAVRDHTERMLSALGATVTRTGTTTSIDGPSQLKAFNSSVPGDFSSASAWMVAGALHADAHLQIRGVSLNPTRTALIDVVRAMGADLDTTVSSEAAGEPVGDIEVRGGRQLRAISLDADDVAPLIDELPLLAVVMAAADGTSEVRGAGELRVKESDRIAAMGRALTAAGANFAELTDGWRITPGKRRDARVTTHADHRIAMAMAVAAWSGVASSVELDDHDCVDVSYPTFWRDAQLIGAM
jgi:3-phosphoshikimate 1-carboxyvinyltransferase